MHILINPYIGTDSQLNDLSEKFLMVNFPHSIKTKNHTNNLKTSLYLMSCKDIEQLILETVQLNNEANLTVSILALNNQDLKTLIGMSIKSNWKNLNSKITLKIVLIEKHLNNTENKTNNCINKISFNS